MSVNGEVVQTSTGEFQALDLGDEVLVDQLWQELRGRVPRTQIRQLVKEAASEFAHATITTYVPIFVRRRVREQLVDVLGN
jgi:hypothetical protein